MLTLLKRLWEALVGLFRPKPPTPPPPAPSVDLMSYDAGTIESPSQAQLDFGTIERPRDPLRSAS